METCYFNAKCLYVLLAKKSMSKLICVQILNANWNRKPLVCFHRIMLGWLPFTMLINFLCYWFLTGFLLILAASVVEATPKMNPHGKLLFQTVVEGDQECKVPTWIPVMLRSRSTSRILHRVHTQNHRQLAGEHQQRNTCIP